MFVTIWSLAAEPEHKTDRHARFLALGDSPPFRQEIRNGVRYELDPPPDSIPPREVVPRCGKESAAAVALHLEPDQHAGRRARGRGDIDLRRAGEAPDALPWLRINRPAAGDFLVLLWRNPAKKTWRDAV